MQLNNIEHLSDSDWEFYLSYKPAKKYVNYILETISTPGFDIGQLKKIIQWYATCTSGTIFENIKPIEKNYLFYRARIYDRSKDIHYGKGKDNTPFKGYDAEASFLPPTNCLSAGRANKQGIPCLYVANNIYTAVSETFKTPSDQISVATISLKEHLYVLKLAQLYSAVSVGIEQRTLWAQNFALEITRLFQTPTLPNSNTYLVCQAISKIICDLDLDGITFYSSKASEIRGNEPNVNIAIFSPQKCEAISSKIVFASDILKEGKNG